QPGEAPGVLPGDDQHAGAGDGRDGEPAVRGGPAPEAVDAGDARGGVVQVVLQVRVVGQVQVLHPAPHGLAAGIEQPPADLDARLEVEIDGGRPEAGGVADA